jgi:MinD superfamily P-loop ATPase
MNAEEKEKEHLHIFVNRRKFEEGDGVPPEMTGAQIAALVEVPADNAVVRLESGGEPREIPVTEKIHIKNGTHFLVTHKKEHLHIFVNRRKFEEGDGVQPEMTGAQIAALVEVPADNAVVRLESGGEPREIPVTEKIHIKNGMHFLVTRKIVEGGNESGAH